MRGRKPKKFILKPKDKTFLRDLLRDGQTSLRVARRARILLSRVDPRQRVVEVGDKVDAHASTVWRVCERYCQHGIQAALYDARRSGRRRVFFQKPASTH